VCQEVLKYRIIWHLKSRLVQVVKNIMWCNVFFDVYFYGLWLFFQSFILNVIFHSFLKRISYFCIINMIFQLLTQSSKRQYFHVLIYITSLLYALSVKKKCPTTYRNTNCAQVAKQLHQCIRFCYKKTQMKTPKRPHGAHYEFFHFVSSNKPFLLTLEPVQCLRTRLLWFRASLRARVFFKPLVSSLNHWAGQKQFLPDQSLEMNSGPHEPKRAECKVTARQTIEGVP